MLQLDTVKWAFFMSLDLLSVDCSQSEREHCWWITIVRANEMTSQKRDWKTHTHTYWLSHIWLLFAIEWWCNLSGDSLKFKNNCTQDKQHAGQIAALFGTKLATRVKNNAIISDFVSSYLYYHLHTNQNVFIHVIHNYR